ncbi:CRISPR-associated protein Cas6 [Paenibacillus sp. MER TA 81-3]|uniref:CRISPR-associated protein Cas6 n=1 Tax=Paenibacillus sp. MER TA 81-3 TaxID=2939573 RepID=UPI00203BB16F|nr:CRISPR-associated protein Cas6 [Paenibacillus sp. MER TA 81-3]MCM3337626.1 CRISPR-associated protein Cas6 [Paenibacillus sp. MER TA 81-3]
MFYELKATVILKQAGHHLEVPERIGAWIGKASLHDPVLKQTHYETAYKHYVYGSPYPREQDGVYKQGRAYVIVIRSSIEQTLRRISAALQVLREDTYIELLAVSGVYSKQLAHITELTTVTPAIVTVDNKPWVSGGDIELLLKQIHSNAEKKRNSLYPDEPVRLDYYFAEGIQVLNMKPIAYCYKGRKLLGNKLRLLIREDALSQQLAHVVLGSGISEKNSILGAGFCLAKGLE